VTAAIIVLLGFLAYCDSFSGPFIFDDVDSILRNTHIRKLWPITETMKGPMEETAAGRPILSLSLAINYAIDGYEVWSYHVWNLVVHLLGGLTLFGIVRRTLNSRRLRKRFGPASLPLAGICALIWTIHPLQTQAVTYTIQRAESMTGLFYLLTLYCAIRGSLSRQIGWLWYIASVVFCALGMGTKEVMVTAPIIVLIYDRIFISDSFDAVLKRRWGLYVGLAATWGLLGWIIRTSPREQSAGFGLEISWLDYAKSQAQAILRYLKLSFWPAGQILDYQGWKGTGGAVLYASAASVAILLGLTILGLLRSPGAGFLGVWFFVILGPSSSFIPIADRIFEHRMYLSLGAVVCGSVLGIYFLYDVLIERSGSVARTGRIAAAAGGYLLAAAVVLALGSLTFNRNKDYKSKIAIWEDNTSKWPGNARAHNNLGLAYAALAEKDDAYYHKAIEQYDLAVKFDPTYGIAYSNRGVAHARFGNQQAALEDFGKTIEIYMAKATKQYGRREDIPENKRKKYASAYGNRGIVYKNMGQYQRAIQDYNRALDLYPRYPRTLYNRAIAYQRLGEFELALADLNKAIELDQLLPEIYDARGVSYWNLGKYDLAIRNFEEAVSRNPDEPSFQRNLREARKQRSAGKSK